MSLHHSGQAEPEVKQLVVLKKHSSSNPGNWHVLVHNYASRIAVFLDQQTVGRDCSKDKSPREVTVT